MRALSTTVSLLVLLAGCTPKAEDIERWKGTQKGPGKLKEAAASASLSDELRGQAVAALFEIGDAQGALDGLAKQDKTKQAATVHAALTILEKQLGEEGPKGLGAKDALFSLRDAASQADRTKIDTLLVAWLCKDLAGRLGQGGHSGEKILVAAGPIAAAALVPLAQPASPQLALVTALLGKLPDAAARTQVVDRLIAAAQRFGTGEIPQPLIVAIAQTGGPRAGEFLIEVAESPRKDSRANALVALISAPADTRNDKVLAGCARIALDKKAPGKAREAAFNVAEKLGPSAVGTLVKLIDQPEETLRWRAVEAALVAGGEAAIGPSLRALPAGAKYKLEDLDSYVVHDVRKVGDKAVPALAAILTDATASPVTKIAALRALGAVGKAADAPKAKALVGDTKPLANFVPPTSIGKEAEAAAASLAKR